MNDSQNILYELHNLIKDCAYLEPEDILESFDNYIQQKRLEFQQPCGDCCG